MFGGVLFFFSLLLGNLPVSVPCAWGFACMGLLGECGCSPAPTRSSPSPQCLLGMDARFLPGVSRCPWASCLLQPPTNCSSHPQTHALSVPSLCLCVLCSSSCWASEATGRDPVFPHHGAWGRQAPCTTLGTGPSAPETTSSPELSHARILCAPSVRGACWDQGEDMGGTAQGLWSITAVEGQNHCRFSGKTSSLPVPLELFLHMEDPASQLPAVCATSCCLCAPAVRRCFFREKKNINDRQLSSSFLSSPGRSTVACCLLE